MRLFLDANVLFSAAHAPGGRALALFRLADLGRCTLCASSHVVEEARRNLATRPGSGAAGLADLAAGLEQVPGAPAKLVAWAGGHGLGSNDAPVLAAAVLSRADVLVTGDRANFGELYGRELGGVTVLSPSEALARVLETVNE